MFGDSLYIFDHGPMDNFFMKMICLPFAPFLLIICESQAKLKLQFCKKDDIDDCTNKYKNAKKATCSFIRTELGCETTIQSFLGLLLLIFSMSETRISETLSIFDEKEDDEFAQIIGLSPRTLIVLANGWSLISGWRSFIRGMKVSKDRFPFLSELVLAVHVGLAMVAKVVACLLFLTPSLGLFDSLRHYQGLLMPYEIVTLSDSDPDTYGHLNFTTDSMSYSNLTFPWAQLSLHDYSNPLNPVKPEVTIFTVFTDEDVLKWFWFLLAINVYLIMVTKFITNRKLFNKLGVFQMLSHCIENIWIPGPLQDWDHGHATLEEYRKRRRKIDWEIGVSTLVNLVISILMLIPVQILALNVNKRHQFLLDTIGPLPEEIDAHWKINFMAVWMVPIFIGGALVQFLAYCAYNRVFHPFQDLMTDPGIEKKYSTLKSSLATPIYNF